MRRSPGVTPLLPARLREEEAGVARARAAAEPGAGRALPPEAAGVARAPLPSWGVLLRPADLAAERLARACATRMSPGVGI